MVLNNKKLRYVINSITTKAVLILGRFSPKRKAVLDAIHKELRDKGYLPILFDFKKPDSRDLTETVSTLAHLSRFIIADLTDAKSIPQELQAIIPTLRVPIQPLIHNSQKKYALFASFRKYPWVLETYSYATIDKLVSTLRERVITPAEHKVKEIDQRKNDGWT